MSRVTIALGNPLEWAPEGGFLVTPPLSILLTSTGQVSDLIPRLTT